MVLRVNWMPPRRRTISPESFERGFQSVEAQERREYEREQVQEEREFQKSLQQDQQEFEKELAQIQATLELPLYRQLQRKAQAAREAGDLEQANKLMADADKARQRLTELQGKIAGTEAEAKTKGEITGAQKTGMTPYQKTQTKLSEEDLELQRERNKIQRQESKNLMEYRKNQNQLQKERLEFRKWASEMERLQAKADAQDKLISEAPAKLQKAYANTLKSLKTLYGDQLPEKVSASDFGALRTRIGTMNQLFKRHGLDRQFKLTFETPDKAAEDKGAIGKAWEWLVGKDTDKGKVKLGMPVIKYRDSQKEPWKTLTTEGFVPAGGESPRGYPGTAPETGSPEAEGEFEYMPFPDINQ
jgi:chromosome segregation ATPase